jgi:hypothetical protein
VEEETGDQSSSSASSSAPSLYVLQPAAKSPPAKDREEGTALRGRWSISASKVVSLYKAGKGQSALQIKAGAGAWHACSGSDKATPPSRTHKGGVFLRAPAPARRRFFVLACVRCVCVVEPCSTKNEGVCVFRAVKTRERRPRARGLAPCFFHGMGTVAVCELLLSSIDPSATLSLSLSLSLETCCRCIRIRAVYPCFDFDTNPARSTERSRSCVQATRGTQCASQSPHPWLHAAGSFVPFRF